MNRVCYDISQIIATACITAGTWGSQGWPTALITAGALILALGVLDLLLLRSR
jgi:hypothetical protein